MAWVTGYKTKNIDDLLFSAHGQDNKNISVKQTPESKTLVSRQTKYFSTDISPSEISYMVNTLMSSSWETEFKSLKIDVNLLVKTHIFAEICFTKWIWSFKGSQILLLVLSSCLSLGKSDNDQILHKMYSRSVRVLIFKTGTYRCNLFLLNTNWWFIWC